MKYRTLGRTGLQISEIGFGAWGIGNTSWIGADDSNSIRALVAAHDAGVNFFDTALSLVTLAQARLAFKCTAGLHHAVRHRAADTGLEHHGFLNVLLAVATTLMTRAGSRSRPSRRPGCGAGRGQDQQPGCGDRPSSPQPVHVVGTCSTDEPVNDLVMLGLVGRTDRRDPVCASHVCDPASQGTSRPGAGRLAGHGCGGYPGCCPAAWAAFRADLCRGLAS